MKNTDSNISHLPLTDSPIKHDVNAENKFLKMRLIELQNEKNNLLNQLDFAKEELEYEKELFRKYKSEIYK